MNQEQLKIIESQAEEIPEKLGWPNDGTAEANDIKKAFIEGAAAMDKLAEAEIERLKKLVEIEVHANAQSDALSWTKDMEKVRDYMNEQWQQYKKRNNL